MRLVLAEPKLLRDSVILISELVNDVTIKVKKDMIDILAMDPANVAMVSFQLLSSAFVEYDVDEEKEITISLENLKQILRRAKSSDVLSLEMNEANKLKIRLKGESTRTFNLALIDMDEEEQKIPDLKFTANVEMPTIVFDEAIEDMGIIAESVVLIVNKDKFSIKSEGKLHNAHVEVGGDEETNISVDGDKVESRYSIDYLKKISKASKLADTVNLYFDKDYPLKAEYKVMDKLQLSFILAPRVSD